MRQPSDYSNALENVCMNSQMTSRLDMYAKELAEAIKPEFKPQVIKQ